MLKRLTVLGGRSRAPRARRWCSHVRRWYLLNPQDRLIIMEGTPPARTTRLSTGDRGPG